MSKAEYITGKICMTKDIGTNGNLFGGIMMSWIDEAAAIYVRKTTQEARIVTLKYTEIVFEHPVRVSDMVEFYASNPRLGRSSITFDLIGKAGEKQIIRTTCTFVAVDETGRPKKIERALTT